MSKRAIGILGIALAIAVVAMIGLFVSWTDAPASIKEIQPVVGCGANPSEKAEKFTLEKLGTFNLKWHGDSSVLIETWVGHTGLRKPDRSSVRASWRGSKLRLSYSTIEPSLPAACLEYLRIVIEVNNLPKRDYEVAWGDWFSNRIASR